MIALFFDTETTGVKSWQNPDFVPKLVQIGAILQDLDTGRVLAEQNMIVRQNPDTTIPEGAAAVHGITDEMCDKFGFKVESADGMFAVMLAMSDLLVAHNIDYDLEVLKDNMPKSQGALDYYKTPIFCTMKENIYQVKQPLTDKQRAYFGMKGIDPDAPYKVPNLMATYEHYLHDKFEGAHDAMADIRACRDIFLRMLVAGWIEINGNKVQHTDKFNTLIKEEKSKWAKKLEK